MTLFPPFSLNRPNIKVCVLLPSVFPSTAQVKEGEVVLTHAGASGVGTAAVQLVRLFSAVPIVTAGSPQKLKMAEELGAATGFNYKEENFAQGVHNFTGGELPTWELSLSIISQGFNVFELFFLWQGFIKKFFDKSFLQLRHIRTCCCNLEKNFKG